MQKTCSRRLSMKSLYRVTRGLFNTLPRYIPQKYYKYVRIWMLVHWLNWSVAYAHLMQIAHNYCNRPLILQSKTELITKVQLHIYHLKISKIIVLYLKFIDWLIEWLIVWLTDWLLDWLIDWLTDWLIDYLSVYFHFLSMFPSAEKIWE